MTAKPSQIDNRTRRFFGEATRTESHTEKGKPSATKMPQTSKKAKPNGAKMPDSVISAARKANSDVEKVKGEDLYIIRVTNGDKACDIINKWITGLPDDVDPKVMAT